jgi:hypothetical protein
MKNHSFLFIGGVHKSGTSLLHDIIRSHPEISGFTETGVPRDEGQLLQSVYFPAYAYGGAGRFGFHEESFMDETHPLATEENAAALFSQWSTYWDLDKAYLVEKSPPNIVRTRFLQKLFPNTIFIIILRHPVAIAYATQKWRRNSVPTLIDHTLTCYERFARDISALENVYVLRYEELVQEPDRIIAHVFAWIEVSPHNPAMKIVSDINESYFFRWEGDQQQHKLGNTQGRFTGSWFGKGDNNLEERANVFGYSLIEPKKTLPLQMPGSYTRPTGF